MNGKIIFQKQSCSLYNFLMFSRCLTKNRQLMWQQTVYAKTSNNNAQFTSQDRLQKTRLQAHISWPVGMNSVLGNLKESLSVKGSNWVLSHRRLKTPRNAQSRSCIMRNKMVSVYYGLRTAICMVPYWAIAQSSSSPSLDKYIFFISSFPICLIHGNSVFITW